MEKRNVHTQEEAILQNKKNIAIDLFRKFISIMNRLFAVIQYSFLQILQYIETLFWHYVFFF